MELPGFGVARDARWRSYSVVGRAKLVLGFADAMKIDRFAVLGHSMGGAPAIAVAAAAPERVTALVTLAGIGLRRHRAMFMSPFAARSMLAVSYLPFAGRRMVRELGAAYERLGFPDPEQYTLKKTAGKAPPFS